MDRFLKRKELPLNKSSFLRNIVKRFIPKAGGL
jgi:hypothetical protein